MNPGNRARGARDKKNSGFTPPFAECRMRRRAGAGNDSEKRMFEMFGVKQRAGFTILEIGVMLAIVTAISAIVLVSFTGLHEGAAVNRAARELALAMRRAQNMSFAVTRVDTAAGPKIPQAVGVRASAGSPIYFIFADMVRDNGYSGVVINSVVDAKVVGGETTMEGGVVIASLTAYDALLESRTVPVAHVIFVAPEAVVILSDASGASLGDVLEIGLASRSGAAKKKIVVRTSGQISIK